MVCLLDVLADDLFTLLVILTVPTLLSMLAAITTFIGVSRLIERRSE